MSRLLAKYYQTWQSLILTLCELIFFCLPSLPFCTLTCIRYADVHYIQMSRFGCPNLVSKYSCCVGPGRWDSETLLHLLKINPVLLTMFAQNYWTYSKPIKQLPKESIWLVQKQSNFTLDLVKLNCSLITMNETWASTFKTYLHFHLKD